MFTRFCATFAVTLNPVKSDVVSDVNFMGLIGWFPIRRNSYQLRIFFRWGKRGIWGNLLLIISNAGPLSTRNWNS